ncbi:hypothetical protein [Acidovorax cavernicola]|uniref:hypothetical protein n=1 Tax=Acidovorax cavernicola TaxID=1675792 RepID=UPI00257050C9|nr:hypothetical protein [Acidovorax cavernicola]
MPVTPSAAPTAQRRLTRVPSRAISSAAENKGAEPMDTTVPMVTPARRIDP